MQSSDIDFSKYKRFFAIGCSFTKFMWPTWADLIAKEMPHSEYYNLGQMGAGNLYISLRLAEAHARFNLCETDLVGIMWSTFSREDRWVKDRWVSLGNIFRKDQSFYPPGWIKRCADPVGYLIRDLGLISLSNEFLKPLKCTFIELFSQSVTHHLTYDEKFLIYPNLLLHPEVDNFLAVYSDIIKRANKNSLITYMTDENNNIKIWTNYNNTVKDSHPSPLTAYDYLTNLNLPLTDLAKNHAIEIEQIIYRSDNIRSLMLGTPSAVDLL